ncbi:MAG: YggS family pyridoxal phosphate-dependent enzyme [Synergistaceae bacterium]|jgi:pyridoxal phosphate enzyme (YggS family)|nr:YggS family pyridoxal phosphate-dependent enzyme [Synergistaceae bacterium]
MVTNDIKKNIEIIRQRIELSLKKSNRKEKEVKLMAVSKFHPIEKMLIASSFVDLFGENRVQEAEDKSLLWPEENSVPWHLIGPLQRNKVRKAVSIFDLIESVDTLKLAETINRVAKEQNVRKYPIFIEVNMSDERSKIGIAPEGAEELMSDIMEKCPHISIEGLMTIGPNTNDVKLIRKAFEGLRNKRDFLRTQLGLELPELSMGMSGDFEFAIEAGSTIVRLGTSIFGDRNNN